MRRTSVVEFLIFMAILSPNLIFICFLVFGDYEEIPQLTELIVALVTSVVAYMVGRSMAFRHSIGPVEQRAVELVFRMKATLKETPQRTKLVGTLAADFGLRAAELSCDYLIEKGILRIETAIKRENGPHQVEVVDATWRAHLI